LAGTGSFERGGQPRSVPDPDERAYDEAMRQQRAYNARQEARKVGGLFPDVGHPGELEALIPIWGPGREALADAHDGDFIGAVGNGVLAVTDVVPTKAVVGGLAKGAVKVSGPHVWRTKPWEAEQGVRQWMGQKGFLQPGEHGHHWLIPRNGWGKAVPDWLKNQPWNIYGRDAVTHGRLHGRYTVEGVKLPRFSPAERLLHGVPPSAQAAAGGAVGRAGSAGGRQVEECRAPKR